MSFPEVKGEVQRQNFVKETAGGSFRLNERRTQLLMNTMGYPKSGESISSPVLIKPYSASKNSVFMATRFPIFLIRRELTSNGRFGQ